MTSLSRLAPRFTDQRPSDNTCKPESSCFISQCAEQVSEVLRYVEAGALLPPLVVLQALAKNSHLRLDIVKAYIQRQLKGAAASIDADRSAITRFQTETAAMRAEVTELKTQVGRQTLNRQRSACACVCSVSQVCKQYGGCMHISLQQRAPPCARHHARSQHNVFQGHIATGALASFCVACN